MGSRFLRALAVAVPVAALLAAAQLYFVQTASSATGAAVRIMPLGDSITGNPGCWRALLWQKLQSAGYTSIDMVGTQPPQGCGIAYDGDNEGHGGALVTSVADQNQLPAWLSATNPDIVLMHFGTNDVWSNRSTEQILAAYSKLVDQMRASNAQMRILVAQIVPVAPSTCAECPQRTVDLNEAIPGWASAKSTAQSPVTVVDQWTGWSAAADTSDGVHPNDSGIRKMADRWYPPLAAALGGTTPSSGPPPSPSSSSASPSRPSSSSVTSAAPAACDATFRVTNQWSGGFQGEIVVTNTGTAAIRGWTVTFAFANGQAVTQAWGGTVSQSGSAVTLRNAEWNGALGVNASTAAGFIGTWNGSTNAAPAATCTAN